MHELTTYEDIVKAYQFLQPKGIETPIFRSPTLERMMEKSIYFKMENFQKTGSFKYRGASYKLHTLNPEDLKEGVLAVSAGNHAQGVAFAASLMGIPATIFMPEDTPQAKINATKGYGGRVILAGKTFGETVQHAQDYLQRYPLTFINAFDDKDLIAGQGTVGVELFSQLPFLDTVVAPIGGGGLMSGVSTALKHMNPYIKIIGVEVENFPAMHDSLEKGSLQTVGGNPTIAEGVAVETPGEVCYELIKKNVDEIVTVTEEQVAQAIQWYFERMKVVVEGAGATSLAALLNHTELFQDSQHIGLVVSGGNIDMGRIPKIEELASAQYLKELKKEELCMSHDH